MKYLLLILFFRFTACEDNHSTKPHHLDNEGNLVIDSVERVDTVALKAGDSSQFFEGAFSATVMQLSPAIKISSRGIFVFLSALPISFSVL